MEKIFNHKNFHYFVCIYIILDIFILLEPLGIVTKVEKEGEEEEKEEGEERKKEEEEEGKERMSYPGDPMLEDESLQYRVQGTFSQHRYSYLHCYKGLPAILTSFGLIDWFSNVKLSCLFLWHISSMEHTLSVNHVGFCDIFLLWSRLYLTIMFVSVTYLFHGAYFI
jgi:hypothetical protein